MNHRSTILANATGMVRTGPGGLESLIQLGRSARECELHGLNRMIGEIRIASAAEPHSRDESAEEAAQHTNCLNCDAEHIRNLPIAIAGGCGFRVRVDGLECSNALSHPIEFAAVSRVPR
jgi:hypothetical protein